MILKRSRAKALTGRMSFVSLCPSGGVYGPETETDCTTRRGWKKGADK